MIIPWENVSLGTLANARDGTPNRECWERVNTALTAIKAGLTTVLTTVELDAAILTLGTALSDLAAVVGGKANTADVTGKADLAQVGRADAEAVLTELYKLRLSVNTGQLVSLPLQLIPNDENFATGEWELPVFPDALLIHSITPVIYSSGGGRVSYTLVNGSDATIGAKTGFIMPGGNLPSKETLTVVIDRIAALDRPVFKVTEYVPDYLDTDSLGLVLWVRGLWML